MRGRSAPSVTTPVLALLALAALAGCAGTGGKTAGGGPSVAANPTVKCGTARTAGGVPVDVEVAHGTTACAVALRVERDYERAVASGHVPGNGGGAPVTIQGWTCQGFNTPEVLSTGDTSACRRGGAEIMAVLQSPPPGTPSP